MSRRADLAAWTKTAPKRNAAGLGISNTRSAQGTFSESALWNKYAWIGGDGYPNANFYLATADAPEGPWTEPTVRRELKGDV